MSPNSLERLLKSLEGHAVNSVELESKDGFLQVKLSAIELGTRLFKGYWPDKPKASCKTLSFSVMWKKDVEAMLEGFNEKVGEANSRLKLLSSELGEIVENMQEAS